MKAAIPSGENAAQMSLSPHQQTETCRVSGRAPGVITIVVFFKMLGKLRIQEGYGLLCKLFPVSSRAAVTPLGACHLVGQVSRASIDFLQIASVTVQ